MLVFLQNWQRRGIGNSVETSQPAQKEKKCRIIAEKGRLPESSPMTRPETAR